MRPQVSPYYPQITMEENGTMAKGFQKQRVKPTDVMVQCKDHWIIIVFPTAARCWNPAILAL